MRKLGGTAPIAGGLACLIALTGSAIAGDAAAPYPNMAPLAQYRMGSPEEEVALARSAAPLSISADAEVLVLGAQGYETAVKGKNGFVCLVARSWAAGFEDPEFWNPKLRSPNCYNPAGARSVVPPILERTRWALAGVSRRDMIDKVKAQLAAKSFPLPEPGAMTFMQSKQGYVSDADGHWHPHLMFFLADAPAAAWGANLPGSPVFAAPGNPEPVTTFLVPVRNWSDGTPDLPGAHPGH